MALGEELFHHEWVPGDERSSQGDGLGPVYNGTSCVACHNLGAPGGGGANDKNIVLLSAIPNVLTFRTAPPPTPVEEVVSAPPKSPARRAPAGEMPPSLAAMFAFVRGENARLGNEASKQPPPLEVKIKTPSGTTTTTTTVEVRSLSSLPAAVVEKLAKIHPGLKTSSSVVLHHFGTNPDYLGWRANVTRSRSVPAMARSTPAVPAEMRQLQSETQLGALALRRTATQFDGVFVIPSERNTTALFGAGLIAAIPTGEIEAVASEQHVQPEFPEIQGRPCRLKDGQIGRFGWKGQMASLGDFVLNACAVELGLEVPAHAQARDPLAPEAKAKGLDLTEHECAALTAFVASLPAPVERRAADEQEKARIERGRAVFASTGCATCHRPALGTVTGIYSDLLLHNMGPSLADSGAYGVNLPDSSEEEVQPGGRPVPLAVRGTLPAGRRPTAIGAGRQEWRTPPLWGLRDSAPYLHDGRAATIEQAVALHGGEAQKTAQRFFTLTPEERLQVMTFLKSLVAPASRSEAGG
jgi:cytochrome c peroxidase